MKRILIFACFVTLAVALTSDEMIQRYTNYMRESAETCVKEMGLDEDILDRFLTARHNTDIEPMGCLKACAFRKVGVMANGELLVDGLHDLTDIVFDDLPEIAQECKKVQATCVARTKHIKNECELALKYFNCGSAGLYHVT